MAHYRRLLRYGDPLKGTRPAHVTDSQRFFSKVNKTDTCWRWVGAIKSNGYGVFACGGRQVHAHRWSYEAEFGPITDGLVVDHICRQRDCVKPDHLEQVTQRENMIRSLPFRPEPPAACPSGHLFTPENTKIGSNGARRCRICSLVQSRAACTKWREKKRSEKATMRKEMST